MTGRDLDPALRSQTETTLPSVATARRDPSGEKTSAVGAAICTSEGRGSARVSALAMLPPWLSLSVSLPHPLPSLSPPPYLALSTVPFCAAS